MSLYSIKDLENLTGIKAHTIRIWERRYGILIPKRTETNIRYYDDDDLRRILNISILNSKGFKISRISKLSDTEIEDKIESLTAVSGGSIHIESLVIAMIKMDERSFNDIITKSILENDFENTFISIVFPFLQRLGMLWQTGSINPGQEHFISNLIRQRIIVNIDSLKAKELKQAKRFILFLPEGEIHEIGLLFLAYMIKKRGHELIYLGQYTPMESVIEANRIKPADILVTSFITSLTGISIQEYSSKLINIFPKKKIIITGQFATDLTKAKNLYCFSENSELIKFLDKLS